MAACPPVRMEVETESLHPHLKLLPKEFHGNPLRTMSRGYSLRFWQKPMRHGQESGLAGAEYGLYLAPHELDIKPKEARNAISAAEIKKVAEKRGVTISVPPYETSPQNVYIKIARKARYEPKPGANMDEKFHEPVHAAFIDLVNLARKKKGLQPIEAPKEAPVPEIVLEEPLPTKPEKLGVE